MGGMMENQYASGIWCHPELMVPICTASAVANALREVQKEIKAEEASWHSRETRSLIQSLVARLDNKIKSLQPNHTISATPK